VRGNVGVELLEIRPSRSTPAAASRLPQTQLPGCRGGGRGGCGRRRRMGRSGRASTGRSPGGLRGRGGKAAARQGGGDPADGPPQLSADDAHSCWRTT
jgi:hypothetical protein